MAAERRWWRRIAIAALFAVALGAVLLGKPPAPSQAAPGRIQVRFWHMWTAEWKVVVDRIVARFNESQERYEVIALSVPPTGAESKFLLAVVGGDPPDVMAQWQNVIPTWADSGMLTPLDTLMSDEERATFEREAYPVVKKIGTYRDHLYGLAIGVNTWACYYRIDHLREAGLDPAAFPRTLEDLVGWGKKLHRVDGAGNLTRLGFLPGWLMMYAPLFGGGFYDAQRQELLLDTPANRRALEYMVERRRELGMDRITRFDSSQNSGFGVEWPFVSGSYSITVDGQWRVEQLAKYAPGLAYGVAPVPPAAGGRELAGYANGNFMLVPRGAKQARGAWEFIRFWSGLAEPERAAEFYTWGGWLPISPAVARAEAYQRYLARYPQFRTFLELMPSKNLETVPPVAFQTYLLDRISAADQSASRGALSPAAALQRLAREMADERARRKELGYAD